MMGLREFVEILKVALGIRKEYAVLEPEPEPEPEPLPVPRMALWETWEGVDANVMAEALDALRQDMEESLEDERQSFRNLN